MTAKNPRKGRRPTSPPPATAWRDPVADVRWVPVELVEPNEYNPNVTAAPELALLYHSIRQDGYTQPVVTVYDAERGRYVIVDGFHRYLVMRRHADIRERSGGLLPVVVLDKPQNDRMASTVRHNRARGRHRASGMAGIVFDMLANGWTEAEVCVELGMSAEEVVRLKYVTGFAKLFEDAEYSRAWTSRRMARGVRREYAAGRTVDPGSDKTEGTP